MSSLLPFSLSQSTVFRRTMIAGLLSLCFVILLLWIAFLVYRWQTEHSIKSSIIDLSAHLEAVVQQEGIDGVVAEIAIDQEPIWDADWLYDIFDNEEHVVRLLNENDETIAGFPGLFAEDDWSESIIEDEPEGLDGHLMVTLNLPLSDVDHHLIVAMFMPERLYWVQELLWIGTLTLLLSYLPLALVTGVLTSRSVFRRLNDIASIAERVGEDRLDVRIPLTGKNDEFDRLSLAVNEMLERINSLTRNLESVSVGAAHDLKTPLSNLGGRLQLIERDIKNPEALQNHLDAAHGHIDALLTTLNALLRLGDIETGKRKNAFQATDLSALTTDLADSMTPIFEEADKRFEYDVQAGVVVQGDRDLLIQMLINLLENAVEHTRDGARVWLKLHSSGKHITIEIGDDGPGIPDSVGQSIFERFTRLDASRGSAGNGLGLSLVKSIAALHDGSVQLRTNRPGCIFHIILPQY